MDFFESTEPLHHDVQIFHIFGTYWITGHFSVLDILKAHFVDDFSLGETIRKVVFIS